MTSIFIIYIIGYIISLFSWIIVIAAIIAVVWQYVEDNWNVVIFKKKNNGNK